MLVDSPPARYSAVMPRLNARVIFHGETEQEGRVDEKVSVVLAYPDLKA